MTYSLLEQLVEYRGIETNYTDAWGRPTSLKPATTTKLLAAMGYQVNDPDLLLKQVQASSNNIWLSVLNPVQVLCIEEHLQIIVRLPIELVTDEYVAQIDTEFGEILQHQFVPIEGQLANVVHIEEIEFQEYVIDIPIILPLGYHSLSLVIDDDVLGSMRLIIAPPSCFKPKTLTQDEKVLGLNVQLYSLRSKHNWGVGDFSDLTFLINKLATQGAQFVGLNPIHAMYSASSNAYSPNEPSSRRCLDFIHLDVTELDGYQQTSTQAIVNSADFQQKLQTVRSSDLVDYTLVTELKLTALEAVFAYQHSQYLSDDTELNKSFKDFVAEGGDSLQALAVYDALQENLALQELPCSGWAVFPEALADFQSPAVQAFAKKQTKRVTFFLWLQWQSALQLEKAAQAAQAHNMQIGLCRDLTLGVNPGNADIWGNKALYCTDASVGTPPDIFQPRGHNLGVPPMDPEKLYAQQYQTIIELFAANMRASGALRIEHIMALLKLWWVANGDDAEQGGYVYYPMDDLLAILALESHRHQCVVIAADLGDVPDEISTKLADYGVYSDSSSGLLSLRVEDWIEMHNPFKIPKTSTEYPNWRCKLTDDLQDMFDDSSLKQLAAHVARAREDASR